MEKSATVGDRAVGGASEGAHVSGYAAISTETSGASSRRERVRPNHRLGGPRLLVGSIEDEARAVDEDAAGILGAVREHEGWS